MQFCENEIRRRVRRTGQQMSEKDEDLNLSGVTRKQQADDRDEDRKEDQATAQIHTETQFSIKSDKDQKAKQTWV